MIVWTLPVLAPLKNAKKGPGVPEVIEDIKVAQGIQEMQENQVNEDFPALLVYPELRDSLGHPGAPLAQWAILGPLDQLALLVVQVFLGPLALKVMSGLQGRRGHLVALRALPALPALQELLVTLGRRGHREHPEILARLVPATWESQERSESQALSLLPGLIPL